MGKSRKRLKKNKKYNHTPANNLAVKKMPKELEQSIDFFTWTPIRSANRLMKQLYADDKFYESATHAWVRPEDAKKLFLYGVCKSVIKCCIGIVGEKELLKEVPTEKAKEPIEKILYGAVIDGQSFAIRKSIETLSLLINFSDRKDPDEFYRIYLNAENLEQHVSRQKEFKEFYSGISISNTDSSIKTYKDRILEDLNSLGLATTWFLNIEKVKGEDVGTFKSKRSIYLAALETAIDDERLALGISYNKTYSRLSQSIHPVFGSHDYGEDENNYNLIISNISFLSIVCMHIMRRAYQIAGLEDAQGIEAFMGKDFEKSIAKQEMESLKRDFEEGDLVLTKFGDLAEVLEMKESKYGYKACKVKYISRPPLPEYPEDWLEVPNLIGRPLLRRSNVRLFFEKNMEKNSVEGLGDVMIKILEQPDELLMESAKNTFKELHTRKLLFPMLVSSGFMKPAKEDRDPYTEKSGSAQGS